MIVGLVMSTFLKGYFCDRLIYLCRLIRVYLVFVSYSNTPPFWCIINYKAFDEWGSKDENCSVLK